MNGCLNGKLISAAVSEPSEEHLLLEICQQRTIPA